MSVRIAAVAIVADRTKHDEQERWHLGTVRQSGQHYGEDNKKEG